ncbi:hypothetical protein CTheo_5038 [Ceratobasidium theobromae]|uniref:Transmembrane protein n=1 Tax=Ceratobasidium theobromae TaxID=1582974 RepID=A0A5N5QJ88_9AGAM|nr:hypothetical protein CTheo_5038 [Ceratobasidium theobromae]
MRFHTPITHLLFQIVLLPILVLASALPRSVPDRDTEFMARDADDFNVVPDFRSVSGLPKSNDYLTPALWAIAYVVAGGYVARLVASVAMTGSVAFQGTIASLMSGTALCVASADFVARRSVHIFKS